MNSPRNSRIGSLILLVRDYDEAIHFFTHSLQFVLLEDSQADNGERWVRVAPAKLAETALVLKKATTPEQLAAVGNQAAGGVWLILHSDDFTRDHAHMTQHGVKFLETPRLEPYGTVAIFEDLYGNQWDLIEPG